MIIGVDAYFLTMKHNTGIGYYTLNLLYQLSLVDKKNSYVMYVPETPQSEYAAKITRNKNFRVEICSSPLGRSRRLWLQSLKLRRQFKKDGLDMFWGGGEYIPVLLPKKILAVVTIHDLVFKLFPETVSFRNRISYNLLFAAVVRRADRIVTISHDSAADIQRYLGVAPEKITVIHNGINLDEYTPASKKEKKDFILFVGTLQPRKNLETLIRAFAMMRNSESRLVVVGASGWKNSALSAIVNGLPENVRSRIDFKGYVSGEELRQLYREAQVFCAPSLHEGFGLIIAEAMASGTAVVTTRGGAIGEVFKDAPLYLENPRDAEELAGLLERVLDKPALRTRMVKKGLELVKHYDLKIMGKAYAKYFKD